MDLDKRQRENCAKILINILTAIFVTTVLGKFITSTPFPDWIFTGGIYSCIMLFIFILIIDRELKP